MIKLPKTAFFNAIIPIAQIRQMANLPAEQLISNIKHPDYELLERDWEKWRSVYESGDQFIEKYTKKFSRRESRRDFERRKAVTPIPSFAKAGVNEIKNSIFQRMLDISRVGGPDSYKRATQGNIRGVDNLGATMTWFIGHYVLPEMLTMRRVGVYVDNEKLGPTLADKGTKHPYMYIYKAEDIRSWSESPKGSESKYSEVLLREYEYTKYKNSNLPSGRKTRFRHLFIGKDNFVHVQYYDEFGKKDGNEITLTIKKIPFVIFEISESLLKDVANHQIALLNLESSDMSYALLGNFPLYTEQFDPATNNGYLKNAQQGLDAQPEVLAKNVYRNVGETQQPGEDVGSTQGRRYPKGFDRPGFIAPPTEPLKASMEKQKNLKDDTRQLLFLALSNIQSKMASAESKALDQSGLEAGLSAIGLELEHGEQEVSEYWSMYENSEDVAEIKYPKLWSLKTEEDQYAEIDKLAKLRARVPSLTFQKRITKQMATILLATKVTDAELKKILDEIDAAEVIDCDPTTIIDIFEAGLLDGQTASTALGLKKEVYDKAKADHAERAVRILKAQTAKDAGAAGVGDLSTEPTAGSFEKNNKTRRGRSK